MTKDACLSRSYLSFTPQNKSRNRVIDCRVRDPSRRLSEGFRVADSLRSLLLRSGVRTDVEVSEHTDETSKSRHGGRLYTHVLF
jgi:hypothetical protein